LWGFILSEGKGHRFTGQGEDSAVVSKSLGEKRHTRLFNGGKRLLNRGKERNYSRKTERRRLVPRSRNHLSGVRDVWSLHRTSRRARYRSEDSLAWIRSERTGGAHRSESVNELLYRRPNLKKKCKKSQSKKKRHSLRLCYGVGRGRGDRGVWGRGRAVRRRGGSGGREVCSALRVVTG